jgi:hypothetical protein
MSKNQLFFLSMPLISFLFGYFTLYYFYRPINIKMPNLIGLALSDALTVVTSLGCVLSDYGQIVSEQYTVSTIVAQDPSAFNDIKVGQTVFVTIGQPLPLKEIPSFLGKREPEIQELAEKHSLYIHVKSVYYHGLGGVCCGQFPESGLLLSDQFIIVYIAKGTENRFVMPLLIGRKYLDAEYFLMQHDMVLHSNKMAQGDMHFHTITKQIPFFGDLVPMKKGFVVDVQLSVSKGL